LNKSVAINGLTPWSLFKALSLIKKNNSVKLKPSEVIHQSEWLYLSEIEIKILRRLDLLPLQYDELMEPISLYFSFPSSHLILGRGEKSNLSELIRKHIYGLNLNSLSGDVLKALTSDWVDWALRPEKEKSKKWKPQFSSELTEFVSFLSTLSTQARIDQKRPLLDVVMSLQWLMESPLKYDYAEEEIWLFFLQSLSPWYRVDRKALMNWQLEELKKLNVQFYQEPSLNEENFNYSSLFQRMDLSEHFIFSEEDKRGEPFQFNLEQIRLNPTYPFGFKSFIPHLWDRACEAEQIRHLKNLQFKGPMFHFFQGRVGYILSDFK